VDSDCVVFLLGHLVSPPTKCVFVQQFAELSQCQIVPNENNGYPQLYIDPQLSSLVEEQMQILLMQMDAVQTPVALF
jgi:hypothetical protein